MIAGFSSKTSRRRGHQRCQQRPGRRAERSHLGNLSAGADGQRQRKARSAVASAGHTQGRSPPLNRTPEPEVCCGGSHLVCFLLFCLLLAPRPHRGSLGLARHVAAVGSLPRVGELAVSARAESWRPLWACRPCRGALNAGLPPPFPLLKYAPLDEPRAEVTCGLRPSPRVSGGRNLKKTGSVLWPLGLAHAADLGGTTQ